MNSQPQSMKRGWKRISAVLVCLLLIWLVFGLPDALRNHHNRSEWMAAMRALQSLPRDWRVSIDEYRSAKTDAKSVPAEVTIQELVSAGCLKPADIAAFAGYRTFVSIQADETSPNSVLVRVETPSGRQVVLNSDGSIMMLPHRP